MAGSIQLSNLAELLCDRKDRRVVFYDKKHVASITFAQLFERLTQAADSAAPMGLARDRWVGLVAENGYDALLADLTLLKLGCTTVHLPESAAGEMLALVGAHRLDFALATARHRHVFANSGFVEVGTLGGLTAYRRPGRAAAAPDRPSGTSAVIFSSGTSGRIKKIVVNDEGVLYNAGVFFSAIDPDADDLFLLFLPLSNYQQKLLIYGCILRGVDICLTDAAGVLSALKAIKPTLFLAPPVFYESAWRVVHLAPQRDAPAVIDAPEVARRLRIYFGGRMRLMWSGMAPIAPEILRGFRAAEVPLYEAYGLTEYGPIAANLPGADRPGSVGRPLVEGSVSIADDGEVIVRSPHPLTHGYLDEPANEAAQVYRDAHCIATGDVGYLDDEGFLYIQGRKKETIVTSSGHKVHPPLVERAFHDLSFVNHVVLMGDGMAHLGLLVMLEQEVEGAEEAIAKRIDELNAGICSSSPIRKWCLQTGKFTAENGLLTRNLKLRRDEIQRRYQHLVFS